MLENNLCLLFAFVCSALISATTAQAQPTSVFGLQRNVEFLEWSPLADNAELLRRVTSPLTAAAAKTKLSRASEVMAERPLNLRGQRFLIYAPPKAPPKGFGLLVFVPPWNDAKLPLGWGEVLDQFGMIFVSASKSGNDAGILEARFPLALLEVKNVSSRYKIDPGRIYVAGFSGGSRIALRLAIAYPDVFRGAFLNAGSDPVGRGGVPIPSADLMNVLQTSADLFYATGIEDTASLANDADSVQTLHSICVDGVEATITPRIGHEVASSDVLGIALTKLDQRIGNGSRQSGLCRANLQAKVQSKLATIKADIDEGRTNLARKGLLQVDENFGGLAWPEIIDLAEKCQCHILD